MVRSERAVPPSEKELRRQARGGKRKVGVVLPKATKTHGTGKLRFRDGMVVSTKGEKYYTVKEDVPEHMQKTFVSLKVKTKGKRGAGTR